MKEPTAKTSLAAGRSPVFAAGGMVATSQPLAAEAGLHVLREVGNAADAAIAAAAALNVVEPQSTGMGGDMFMLYWDAGEKKLLGLNGSGRSPAEAAPSRYREFSSMPETGILSCTLPGAVDGWFAALERCGSGRKDMATLLRPAIQYAEKGFPLSPIIGRAWANQTEKLKDCEYSRRTYLPSGRAPRIGERFRNPRLGASLRTIADGGREAFYEGPIAREIVRRAREIGGLFSLEDFAATRCAWVEPIRASYRGHELCEIPPPGQGVTALICLNLLKAYPLGEMSFGSADHLHLMIEAMKLAFADRDRHVADVEKADVPLKGLLSPAYADERRKLIDEKKAGAPEAGIPQARGDTIYLAAADARGGMCSFINSLFHHFGSGVTGGETGIVLQNRGSGFTLEEGHPNQVAPRKRPLHTIIPGFVMRDGEPWMSFGVMGGDMQPQGHAQVLSNMVDFGMDVQQAIDAPRFRALGGREVAIESGASEAALRELEARGHAVRRAGGYEGFGGGQGIVRLDDGVFMGGSDHRRDGCAVGF